ncbi:hypothetical protein STEG23_024011, partial [Scotinomys teguina]
MKNVRIFKFQYLASRVKTKSVIREGSSCGGRYSSLDEGRVRRSWCRNPGPCEGPKRIQNSTRGEVPSPDISHVPKDKPLPPLKATDTFSLQRSIAVFLVLLYPSGVFDVVEDSVVIVTIFLG